MALCNACREGPRGVAGHADLNVRSTTGGHMVLKCAACGALWSREYRGEGQFGWERLEGDSPALKTIPKP